MLFLKYNDAVTIKLGPFLDPTDGVTPVTTLAASMDVQISKLGSAFASRADATAITHDADGFYNVVLGSGDCDSPGRFWVQVSDPANHLPVWCEYMVIYPEWHASLFSGDAWPVNVTSVAGSGTYANNLSDFLSPSGSSQVNNNIGAAVLTRIVETEGSYTLQQALSIILAAVAGVTTDAGETFKTPDGTATRISSTLSSDERTVMNLTPSS